MKMILKRLLIIVLILSSIHASAQRQKKFQPKTVFESTNIRVIQISPNTYQHISYLQTNDFGNVPCNGLVVCSNQEAIIFDTPTNDSSSNELMRWINVALKTKINAIVPTHFHNDCLGGLKAFDEQGIPSYASAKTIDLAKANGYVLPKHPFNDTTVLQVGNKIIQIKYFGEGHTMDNVVAYFPSEQVLFGGCLIKELGASKGYLGDANIETWSSTVTKIKKAYPYLKIVVPGHGAVGNQALLDYTIQLFNTRL